MRTLKSLAASILWEITGNIRYYLIKEELRDVATFRRAKINPETVFVIGDSHTDLFCQNKFAEKRQIGAIANKWFLAANYGLAPRFIVYHLDAVLAYSCFSKVSQNRCREKIDYLLERGFLISGHKIIISLGEIDCRVHVLRQAELNDLPPELIIDRVITSYLKLIKYLQEKNFEVIVYGPPGQQKDSAPFDPSFPRYGTEQQRNLLVKLYNQKLSELSRLENFQFFTCFDFTTTDSLETIAEYYRDGVHLSNKAYNLCMDRLRECKVQM